MSTALHIFGLAMLLAGAWAFTQSRSSAVWPVPIAIGGAVLLLALMR